MTDDSKGKLFVQILNHGFTCQAILLGKKLGIFDHLSRIPKTCEEIAFSSNLRARYVQEWLHILTVSKLVEFCEKNQTYWISEENTVFTEKNHPAMMEISWLTMIEKMRDNVADCFQKDGPLGTNTAEYDDFHDRMEIVSKKRIENWFFTQIIPTVPGLSHKLDQSCQYLDIGCGSGMACFLVAQLYAKSMCIGIDFDQKAIEKAAQKLVDSRSGKNLPNLQYLHMDASKLSEEWTERFDYVTTFDSIHDQAYPDKALAEIFRVLKKGGFYSMVDIDSHSSVSENFQNPNAQALYTMSLFYCTPVSLAHEGGAGLGTMWGREKAAAMLKAVGFEKVIFHTLADFIGHYHCVCEK